MGTLAQMLASADPDAVALVEPERAGSAVTYGQLRSAVEALAVDLARHGVRRGSIVGVWLPTCVDAVVWQFAVASLGAAVLGINTRYGVHELKHLLSIAKPACVAMPADFLGRDFAGMLGESGYPPPAVATVDVAGPPRLPYWSGGSVVGLSVGQLEDPVNYFTTSGSTGLPKLAEHDQRSVVRHAANAAAAFDIRRGDFVLAALPLAGVFGFNTVMAALSAGAACVMQQVFSTADTIEQLQAYEISHVLAGDDLLGRLLDAWQQHPVGFPAWRCAGVADFAGRSAEIAEWVETLGARFTGLYGASEVFALLARWPSDRPLEIRRKAGGVPISPDIQFRIADGELQFRGYPVLTRYLGNPVATADAFTDDGWYRSGDLGEPLDDGFAYLCRMGDALRLRGFLIQPAEIESFLVTHPAVDQAKVVGAGGEAVAFVRLNTSVAEDALVAFCRRNLAAFKVPRRIVALSEFPTTSGTNGTKVRAAELRRIAAELLEMQT
ncbi:AMP-binding protein [Fodinicola acaciae]|uniref:AMP-binding protein n=1 Tax=Fodinicola acaciae TaxID=2681555 RepID=UPI0013CF50B2|nr:AMP-binding protein [Fodinicola acaciae]